MKQEKRLVNGRLLSTTVKELNQVSDKIYENLRAYDVNGKLVTIDLQSIEATTQQQQTMDLQNESSICNFYNNAANKNVESFAV